MLWYVGKPQTWLQGPTFLRHCLWLWKSCHHQPAIGANYVKFKLYVAEIYESLLISPLIQYLFVFIIFLIFLDSACCSPWLFPPPLFGPRPLSFVWANLTALDSTLESFQSGLLWSYSDILKTQLWSCEPPPPVPLAAPWQSIPCTKKKPLNMV
jgi:hypothetical protein